MLYPRQSFVALLLFFSLLCQPTFAALSVLAKGYSVRVWQTEDGLPENTITCAVQTRDGYLWFGTSGGLARFDGERFEVFDSANTPALRHRGISRLFEDAEGTLWIGHDSGTITRYRDGKFESIAPSSSAQLEKIVGLGSDEMGHLWAMRENGAFDAPLAHLHVPSLIAPDLPSTMAWSRGENGEIWVTENGRLAHLEEGKLREIPTSESHNMAYSNSVGASTKGGAWVVSDGRIRRWDKGRWAEDRGPFPFSDGGHLCLELRDRTVALGSLHNGLALVFSDGRPPVILGRNDGLPQDWIRFLYEDGEGNLWAGTGSAGLVSVRPTAFSVLNSPDHWQGCSVLSVASSHDGALWIGSDGAGLYRYEQGKWTNYGEPEGLGNPYLWSVAATAQNEIWVSNYWWGGLYRKQGEHFVRPPHVDEKWSPIYALLSVPETDQLLAGNREGLLKLEGEKATCLFHSSDTAAGSVCAIARDPLGNIWSGFTQGGVTRIVGEKTTTFRRDDGLASDAVQCLFADEDGAVWIGTADRGLSRFKNGKFSNIGLSHGLLDSAISYILDDGLGYFWLSTHHGLQRIEKVALNRCADGLAPTFPSQIYDHNDGLPTIEFAGGRQAAACKTSQGQLWFATSKGLVGVNPSRIQTNSLAPPVVVEAILVDGQPMPLHGNAVPGRLSPDHQRLEFRFSGLSFVAPNKVLFKYRLDGNDQSWVKAGDKRAAFYSHLSAGTYRFRVIACNNDGVWNTQGAVIAFTVAPYFWQTWWFISLSLLAAAGVVAWLARFLTRRRMQRRIEQMERQHELERERARIAQDIHDDVGASLSRIAMLSQPARDDLEEPARAAAMLSRIYHTAREVTRSLDEIVWAVDPLHDTLDSLVDYMGKFAQEFLSSAKVRCRLDLPVEVPALPVQAEARHNLFLSFKEALNNTVRHAAATEVRISVRLEPDLFFLVVTDNGHGFDPSQPGSSSSDRPAAGNGLVNMQQRLTRIGGRCEITSARGGGATVSLIVPLPTPAPESSTFETRSN